MKSPRIFLALLTSVFVTQAQLLPPPVDLIADLIESVDASELSEAQQQGMIKNLDAASSALEREVPRPDVAARRLVAFEKQVREDFPPDSSTASNWVARTEIIINRLLTPVPPLTNGTVLPSTARVAGQTIGGLTVDVWNWIYSISTNENPQLDCGSGRWANNRQPNPVVFLIAPFSGNMLPPCDRTFTMPEHKHVLLPVMGLQFDNIDIDPPLTEAEIRDALDDVLTRNPIELFATIDGVSVPNLLDRRIFAPAFKFNFLDADNLSSLFYGHPVVGLIDPIISDGYWLLLEPLAAGTHVLHTRGTNIYHQPHETTLDVTVEQVPLDEWMAAFKHWVANTPAPLNKKLMSNVNQAQAQFRRGNIRPGINKLRSFQKKVRSSQLQVDDTLANDLMRYAERIIHRAGKEL